MDLNQKKKIFKWMGFGIMMLVFLIVVLFLFGVNMLNFPFPPTLPPAGAIIDFSPLYNLLFWYLSFRIILTVGEKIIVRADKLFETSEQKKEAKSKS